MDLLSIAVVLVSTFCAVIAGFYAYGMGHIREIKQNWVQYRCNPIYMPLAGAVGSDVLSNFTNCTMQSVQSYAGFVMDPIFQNFALFTDLFKNILESIQFIRKKMGGTVDAFLNIVSSIFGKIQNTMTTVLQLVGRVRTIMNRIISVFVVMLHIAKTGVDSGMSIKNGPIGQVAEFLCFDPETPVTMFNGAQTPMFDVTVGSVLFNNQEVTSTMIFDGRDTPMVDINGVRVSANHKILYKDMWIPCSEHPDALPTDSLERLLCFTTSDHTIPILDYTFKDYEETDDTSQFFEDVANYYGKEFPARDNRASGFNPLSTKIRMEDGTVRHIDSINIGDRIAKGGRIVGFLFHKTQRIVKLAEGLDVAEGTVLLDEFKLAEGGTDEWTISMNFLTEKAQVVLVDNTGKDWTILDDQEVPDMAVHDKRDKKVIGR